MMSNLEDFKGDVSQCLRCSMCKWIPQVQIKSKEFASTCPSIDCFNFHGYSGGGRLILALAILSNRLDMDEDVIDNIYKCTECGACDVACKYLNNLSPLEVIQALREKAVDLGVGPIPAQKSYILNILEKHNPYGEPHEKRFDWLPDDIKITQGAELVYFVGCTSSYRRKELAIATARILNIAGIDFDLMGMDEFCCGSPQLRVGDKENFNPIASHNIEKLKKRGIKEVIFSCAGCYTTFKVEYPKIQKFSFKVTHSTEIFNRLLKNGKLKIRKNIDLKVTYHDPCHLGRGSEREKKWYGINVKPRPFVTVEVPPKPLRRGTYGIYEPPREVIQQIPGLEFIEMERIKEYSYCCGAGGGVKSAYPEFALFTSENRIKEAKKTGADAILTACPFCVTNLQDGIDSTHENLECYDICEILLKALESDN
ncbi:MAG: (Fe-S)-binding protein [archaeon]|nr:(Fe-S)-binding protein [archaeon]